MIFFFAEQDVDDVIEVESRRKKVLLSTLSRLKKDVSRAKRIAKDILQLSKKQGDGSDGGDGGDGETEQLFPIDTHCEPLQPVKKRAKKNLRNSHFLFLSAPIDFHSIRTWKSKLQSLKSNEFEWSSLEFNSNGIPVLRSNVLKRLRTHRIVGGLRDMRENDLSFLDSRAQGK